jgi:hypothetical protein
MDLQPRIKAALEIIEDGHAFRIGNLQLSKVDISTVAVTGWTQYDDLRNLTKSIVMEELDLLKQDFNELVLASIELKEFFKDKIIEHNLA